MANFIPWRKPFKPGAEHPDSLKIFCAECGAITKTYESRNGDGIRKRRQKCISCGFKFVLWSKDDRIQRSEAERAENRRIRNGTVRRNKKRYA